MQKITPFLWFDDNAEEAMNFYVSTFSAGGMNSKILNVSRYREAGPDKKETVVVGSFRIEGEEIYVLNGGPIFKFTPAISFMICCETEKEVDELWMKLSEDGKVLMELAQYPFSHKFGWVVDKFGVLWQINQANFSQKITPFLMFAGIRHGRAEEAMKFYTTLFKNSGIDKIKRYTNKDAGDEGTVEHATFTLHGQKFMCIDSKMEHSFTFSPATSFFVNCDTQQEVDELWEKLSAGGKTSRCGWLDDKFGVTWQIIPSVLNKMLGDPDPVKSKNVMTAMLKMEKLDIKKLEEAYRNHDPV